VPATGVGTMSADQQTGQIGPGGSCHVPQLLQRSINI